MNYIFWTYLARIVGLLLIVPSLFPLEFANRFPGLEDRRIGWALFFAGAIIFIAAALTHHILRSRENERRNRN